MLDSSFIVLCVHCRSTRFCWTLVMRCMTTRRSSSLSSDRKYSLTGYWSLHCEVMKLLFCFLSNGRYLTLFHLPRRSSTVCCVGMPVASVLVWYIDKWVHMYTICTHLSMYHTSTEATGIPIPFDLPDILIFSYHRRVVSLWVLRCLGWCIDSMRGTWSGRMLSPQSKENPHSLTTSILVINFIVGCCCRSQHWRQKFVDLALIWMEVFAKQISKWVVTAVAQDQVCQFEIHTCT